MKERVIPWEMADEDLLRRMESRAPKRKEERTEEQGLRRSKRKRQETARMRDYRENGKRRKIGMIRMIGLQNVNKNSDIWQRPIKEGRRSMHLSYVFASPTTYPRRGDGRPEPACEPPNLRIPDWKQWSGGDGAALGTRGDADGVGPVWTTSGGSEEAEASSAAPWQGAVGCAEGHTAGTPQKKLQPFFKKRRKKPQPPGKKTFEELQSFTKKTSRKPQSVGAATIAKRGSRP
uniref:Uncharacterized protein n=1 Tax=Haemonchus contortus TaxID=6289 RepID=W6NGF1_HAECO